MKIIICDPSVIHSDPSVCGFIRTTFYSLLINMLVILSINELLCLFNSQKSREIQLTVMYELQLNFLLTDYFRSNINKTHIKGC